MSLGNQEACSVRSPRCSQTLGLQSQRKAEDDKSLDFVITVYGVQLRSLTRMKKMFSLTLKMVPGGKGYTSVLSNTNGKLRAPRLL